MTLTSSKRLRSRLALSVVAASSTFLTASAVLMLPALALSGQSPVKPDSTAQAKPASETAHESQIKVDRRTPAYWRVTFDNPPFNIFGPETIPQLEKVIADIETDPKLRVVVFDSDV
ncbi:MAG: enoyl-CoA hydratase/isomerase family protein, partial [Rhizobium leguminosarum]|nr:enoyl-CoA hydratase/isomerase family protein [Rhizobium leguminosarum]